MHRAYLQVRREVRDNNVRRRYPGPDAPRREQSHSADAVTRRGVVVDFDVEPESLESRNGDTYVLKEKPREGRA